MQRGAATIPATPWSMDTLGRRLPLVKGPLQLGATATCITSIDVTLPPCGYYTRREVHQSLIHNPSEWYTSAPLHELKSLGDYDIRSPDALSNNQTPGWAHMCIQCWDTVGKWPRRPHWTTPCLQTHPDVGPWPSPLRTSHRITPLGHSAIDSIHSSLRKETLLTEGSGEKNRRKNQTRNTGDAGSSSGITARDVRTNSSLQKDTLLMEGSGEKNRWKNRTRNTGDAGPSSGTTISDARTNSSLRKETLLMEGSGEKNRWKNRTRNTGGVGSSSGTTISEASTTSDSDTNTSDDSANTTPQKETLLKVEVYDLTGRRIYQSPMRRFSRGRVVLPLIEASLPSATYFARIQIGDEAHLKRFAVLK